MSFVEKRFCFTCKLDTEQLKKKNKKLKTCSFCQIAQYCGQECQRLDFKGTHKLFCIQGFKHHHDLGEKAKKILTEKGHDVDRSSLQEFYNENDGIFQCIKKSNFEFTHDLDAFRNLPLNFNFDLGQVFLTYINCKNYSVVSMDLISRQHESYHGLQMTLEANLEVMMSLQPDQMYFRGFVPIHLIQLGQDDEAYNFIKFWLKNTPKGQDFTVGEEGLFPDLPFKEHTMKDQDKNEDIFEALGIKFADKPYFIYITFYVCLAIIKKNNYCATKDKNQLGLFIKYLGYVKKHFGNILKNGLLLPPISAQNENPFQRFTPQTIPAKYGLKRGVFPIATVQTFASDFVHTCIDDLNSYLIRAPDVREGLVDCL
jgi:hypothetical protein